MPDTQDSPLCSIIIPCFRQARWLPDAIESALNQTHKNIEVIVVDDGSDDKTYEVALKYIKDGVKIHTGPNKGLSGARNNGIRMAKGKYVLTLDADDIIMPTFIEKCLEADDDIVSTAQQEFGDSDNLWNWQPEHPRHKDFLSDNQINCCSLYLREIWEEIGGYDENMRLGYEDWDFWLRATKVPYFITVIREPLFLYRKHGQSMVSKAFEYHEEIKSYMLNKLK